MILSLPKDPVMLLSVINTSLRDYYDSLAELCINIGVMESDLCAKLATIDYYYDESLNQFV